MFGYVTVYKPELKIKDYDVYKGVYCTLCKQMQKEYGFFSRFLLSYDAAFYVLYRMGTENNPAKISKSHCSFSPCKKCLKIDSAEEIFKKAAGITVILSYFKLCDSIADSGFFKRIFCRLLKPYFKHMAKKAEQKYPDVFSVSEKYMKNQAEAEKDFKGIDSAAEPTGKALGFIMSDGNENSDSFKVGYFLGRTVYFLDAFDDFEKDVKSNSFNPFKNTDNIVKDASFAINLSIGELTDYIKKTEFYKFKDIIYNIIFEGLDYRRRKIIMKKRGEKDE